MDEEVKAVNNKAIITNVQTKANKAFEDKEIVVNNIKIIVVKASTINFDYINDKANNINNKAVTICVMNVTFNGIVNWGNAQEKDDVLNVIEVKDTICEVICLDLKII